MFWLAEFLNVLAARLVMGSRLMGAVPLPVPEPSAMAVNIPVKVSLHLMKGDERPFDLAEGTPRISLGPVLAWVFETSRDRDQGRELWKEDPFLILCGPVVEKESLRIILLVR
jgi:hypothetical protein